MDLEQLIISVKFDSEEFNAAINALQGQLGQFQDKIADLADKISDKMNDASEDTKKLADTAEETGKKVEEVAGSIDGLFEGLASKVLLPLASFLSFKSVFDNFVSDIQAAAEESGAYNKKLEEERKKREQLARVTKEDIELYVKGKRAIENFQYAIQAISNELARTFNPIIEKSVEWLEKITNWVNANSNNIVRFVKVLAAVISTALLPAILKTTAALLANPLTYIIGLVAALALVIDDLVVYIQGGESELEWFWRKFGTGEEIAKKLRDAYDKLIDIWEKNKKGVLEFLAALGGIGLFTGAALVVAKFSSAISGLVDALAKNPFVFIIGALADFIRYIVTGDSYLASFWQRFGSGKQILETITQYLNKAIDAFNKYQKQIIAAIAILAGFKILGGIISSFGQFASVIKNIAQLIATNPFILLIAALVDLGVYIATGKSALDGLWKKLGTGQEILAKLRLVFDKLVDILSKCWKQVAIVLGAILAYKAVNSIIALVLRLGNAFKSLGALIAANPFIILLAVLADLAAYIITGESLLDGLWKKFGTGQEILNTLKSAWEALKPPLMFILKLLPGLLAGFLAFKTLQGLSNITSIIGGLRAAFAALTATMMANPIIAIISAIIGAIVLLITYWDELPEVVQNAWNSICNIVSTALNFIADIFVGICKFLANVFTNGFNALSNIASSCLSALSGVVTSALNGISNLFSGFGSFIKNIFSNALNGLLSAARNFGNSILNFFKDVLGKIKDFFSSINLFESGQKLLSTFIDGIKSKVAAIIDTVKGVFKKVREYLPFSDAKVGPLSQLTLSGERFVTTFGEGAEQGTPELINSVSNILGETSKTFDQIADNIAKSVSKTFPSFSEVNVENETSKIDEISKINETDRLNEISKVNETDRLNETVSKINETVKEQTPQASIASNKSLGLPSSTYNVPLASKDSTSSKEQGFDSTIFDRLLQGSQKIISEFGDKLADWINDSTQKLSSGLEKSTDKIQVSITDTAQYTQRGFEVLGERLGSSMREIIKPFSAMSQFMATQAAISGPQLALAGISPSITNSRQVSESKTNITTNIGKVSVQTQATDSKGIAGSISGAMKNEFEQHKMYASMSGVRQ